MNSVNIACRSLLLALAISPGITNSSLAHFARLIPSARSLAFGGAFVSVADDASCVLLNPAGLSGMRSYDLTSTFYRPCGNPDAYDGVVAVATRTGLGGLGGAIYSRRLSGVRSETLYVVGYARDIKRTSEDASLSIGISAGLARISVPGPLSASTSSPTAAASVLLRPFATIGVGYQIGNVSEPGLDRVVAGSDTTLNRTHALGLSWSWNQRVLIALERRRDGDRSWRNGGGVEIAFGRHGAVRSGIYDTNLTAGVGFEWNGLRIDTAVLSDDVAGATYLVSIGYRKVVPRFPDAQLP